MTRSEEFAAGSGNRIHPQVRPYRDGGIGGVGPDHSVVGMVPTHVLKRYAEHDGYWNGKPEHHDREIIEDLRGDLRAGHGFHEPLQLHYDNKSQWAYLGEGNHRLRAALEEGVPEVPVRVSRLAGSVQRRKAEGIGGPATHKPIPGIPERDRDHYIPSDIHPSYLNLGERGETRDTMSEIHDLLRPTWGQR